MKRTRFVFMVFLSLMITMLFGCGKASEPTSHTNSTTNPTHSVAQDKIQIMTTIFPLYDFAKQIGGEYVTVKSLIPAGVDPHLYEPTAKEMVELNNTNLFVYNGAGYELWVEKAIQNLNQEKTKVVNASLGLELLAGHHNHDADHDHATEEEHDHDGDHDHATEEEHDHVDHDHGEFDPHVWLDPINAKQQAALILGALIEIAPEHKAAFQSNFERFANELDQLDADYTSTIEKATKKKVVVAHQAFGYLAHRYGFEQIAVSGLSTSNEPSQKELMNIINVLKENDLRYVAFDSFTESKIAKTVQREANAEAVTLNTIENATKDQLAAGVTYIQLMKENLLALKTILEIQD